MASIDILQNPATNKVDSLSGKQEDNNRTSLMSRFLQATARGSVMLPDMSSNAGTRTGNMLADLLGSKVPSQVDKYLDPNEKALIQSGVINPNLEQAQGFGENFVDNAGFGTGAMLSFLPLKGGANQMFGSIPKAASTAGMIAAPAAIGPKVDEWDNHNPFITVPTQILASILGGKVAGGIAKPFSPAESLPEYTAAQNSYMENPDASRTKTLIARQLDLAKKDPQSADAIDKITKNQENKIIENMTPENPISGQDISTKIKDYVGKLKNEKSTQYQNDEAALLMANPQRIDTKPTLNLLYQFKDKAAIGGNLDKALTQVEELIAKNGGDPTRAINLKTSIQRMANYDPQLKLDSQESAIIKQIAHQFGQSIDQAMPGYTSMNKNYSDKTQNLQGIIDGLAGNVVAAGETAPSSILRRIFEKVDPALSGQIKGVLPEGMYGQAADSYLGDVLQRAQTTPSKNVYNNGTQMYKMGDILQQNYPTLQETLPSTQMGKVDQTLKDIDVSMLGRPRNDYTIDARRGYAVGDEVKGLGADFKSGSWINPMTYMRMAQKPFYRNEMLTGQSPTSQIVGSTVPPSIAVGSMNQPQLPTQSVQQPLMNPQSFQQPQQSSPQSHPYVAPRSNGQSPIDQVMKEYGMSQDANGGAKTQPDQALSPIDQVMKDYGIGDSLKKKSDRLPNSSQPKSGSPGAIGSDVLDFMTKEINKGNTDVLLDPKGAFAQSQLKPDVMDVVRNSLSGAESGGNYKAQAPNSSATGKYQFIDGTRRMFFPDSTREEFKNNPQMQEEAMNKLMESNKSDLRNRGVDVDNIAPEDLSGALHAAHLRGSGAGYHALMDANYIGEPDANGTTPRNYFDRGRQAYLDAVSSAQSKQNSEYDDLVSHAESLLGGQTAPVSQGMQNVNYAPQPINENDVDSPMAMNW